MNWVTSIISWLICIFVTVASIAITVILWLTYYDVRHQQDTAIKFSQFDEFLRNENALYAMAIIASIVLVRVKPNRELIGPKFVEIYCFRTIHRCSLSSRFAWCENGWADYRHCSKRRAIVCCRCPDWLDHRWLPSWCWHYIWHSGWLLSFALLRQTIRAWNLCYKPLWAIIRKLDLRLENLCSTRTTAKPIINHSVWSNMKMSIGCATCFGSIWLDWFGRLNLFLVSQLAHSLIRDQNWSDFFHHTHSMSAIDVSRSCCFLVLPQTNRFTCIAVDLQITEVPFGISCQRIAAHYNVQDSTSDSAIFVFQVSDLNVRFGMEGMEINFPLSVGWRKTTIVVRIAPRKG